MNSLPFTYGDIELEIMVRESSRRAVGKMATTEMTQMIKVVIDGNRLF